MPSYAYAILLTGWLAWGAPFFLYKRSTSSPVKVDRRARWGILLEVIAYSLLWQTRFWEKSPQVWRTTLAVLFLGVAVLFSWTAVRSLGRHWRIDAGLDSDHELVRSGPYRIVRHPIYASMLFLLLGTGFLIAPMLLILASLAIFIFGTEIRVRVEDGLLASRFGEQFEAYKRAVPAYIPRATIT